MVFQYNFFSTQTTIILLLGSTTTTFHIRWDVCAKKKTRKKKSYILLPEGVEVVLRVLELHCQPQLWHFIIFADIDECTSRSLNGCGLGALCVNRVPGYTCECPPGFRGDGRTGCEPAEVRTGCESDFDCTNNAQCGADRTCLCRQGFEPKGALCVDVNECARQPDICGPFATCTNTQGGYECRCQPPLTGNPPLEPCKGEEIRLFFYCLFR